jgi:hypothetical protein
LVTEFGALLFALVVELIPLLAFAILEEAFGMAIAESESLLVLSRRGSVGATIATVCGEEGRDGIGFTFGIAFGIAFGIECGIGVVVGVGVVAFGSARGPIASV